MRVVLIYLAIVAVIIAVVDPGADTVQNRRPSAALPGGQVPPLKEPLPGVSPFDPAVKVRVSPNKAHSTGTAFSLGDGNWLTARHVVDGCTQAILDLPGGPAVDVSEALLHPAADLAVVRANHGTDPLPFQRTELQIGQRGFHYGFPKAEAGAASSLLLGRLWLRMAGAMRFSAPGIAWAEDLRIPAGLTHLGGMSGGPVFDVEGTVVGVTIAESLRRGRIIAAAPVSIEELLQTTNLTRTENDDRNAIAVDNFIDYGRALWTARQVARVRCTVVPRA